MNVAQTPGLSSNFKHVYLITARMKNAVCRVHLVVETNSSQPLITPNHLFCTLQITLLFHTLPVLTMRMDIVYQY